MPLQFRCSVVFIMSTLCYLLAIRAIASPPPLPESTTNTIGYPTVAAARKALLAQPDARWYTHNDWLIVVIRDDMAVWSFAPKTDPAYPAVVERKVVKMEQVRLSI